MRSVSILAIATLGLSAVLAGAQPPRRTDPNAERAQIHYRLGWESLRSEAWDAAVKEFQQAIDLNPKLTLAYYGLGKAFMGSRRYSDAARAYETCRDFYVSKAGEKFSGQFDATRVRQDRLMELQDLAQQYSKGPQTPQAQDAQRQIQNAIRSTQEATDRGVNLNIDASAPAFVSLALGSAYFRANRTADAEREYKVAINVDPGAGEAHNNLAVVYMLTGRLDDAAKEVALAEKVGFRVNPEFKKDLAARRNPK
jgi:tetratricopeptide (TPR) repeat protein